MAPWRREAVDFGRLGEDPAGGGGEDGREERIAEALAGLRGKPAIYHCVSRIVDRNFVLQRTEKEHCEVDAGI